MSNSPLKLWRIWVAGIAGILLLGYLLWHRPVLLHVFAETGCACGDYHKEVTGMVVFNPFRDHTPEKIADQFFADLRDGKCSNEASPCPNALERRVSEWRLANRTDDSGTVSLFYKLTKEDSLEPRYRLTGEGLIKLARARNKWMVTYYSSYF